MIYIYDIHIYIYDIYIYLIYRYDIYGVIVRCKIERQHGLKRPPKALCEGHEAEAERLAGACRPGDSLQIAIP